MSRADRSGFKPSLHLPGSRLLGVIKPSAFASPIYSGVTQLPIGFTTGNVSDHSHSASGMTLFRRLQVRAVQGHIYQLYSVPDWENFSQWQLNAVSPCTSLKWG